MTTAFAPAPLPPRPTRVAPPRPPQRSRAGRSAAPRRARPPADLAPQGRSAAAARAAAAAPAHAPAVAHGRPMGRSAATAAALAPARHPRPVPGPDRRPVPAPRPHLRVVQPGERTLRRLTPLGGIVLTAILFVVLAAVAGAHTLIAQGQIRLDGIEGRVQEEQARYQQLRKDVAEAESPARVVAAAEAQGMVAPDDLVYLQPPTDEGTRTADPDGSGSGDADGTAARTAASWDDVKPLLEDAAP